MAGHSHAKNVAVRKGKQDAVRGKIFTKIAREINAACKLGMPDPDHNPRLRAAMLKARSENIPNDKIKEAIKRASGAENTEDYVQVRYEGRGPGGVAIIIEALTDNRNRTVSDIRSYFTKTGGSLGETGSMTFMFDHVGEIVYPASAASADAMLEAAIDAGADDCQSEAEFHTVTTSTDSLGTVRDMLEKKLGPAKSSKIVWHPKTTTAVDGEQAETLLKLIGQLEDNDDVQEVFANYDIPDEVMERLSA